MCRIYICTDRIYYILFEYIYTRRICIYSSDIRAHSSDIYTCRIYNIHTKIYYYSRPLNPRAPYATFKGAWSSLRSNKTLRTRIRDRTRAGITCDLRVRAAQTNHMDSSSARVRIGGSSNVSVRILLHLTATAEGLFTVGDCHGWLMKATAIALVRAFQMRYRED